MKKVFFITLVTSLFTTSISFATSPPPPYITPTDFVIECQVQRTRMMNDQQKSLLAVLSFKRSELTNFGGIDYQFPTAEIWRVQNSASSPATFEVPYLTGHNMYLRISRDQNGEKFWLDLNVKLENRQISVWGEASRFELNSVANASVGEASIQSDGTVLADQLSVLCQRTK